MDELGVSAPPPPTHGSASDFRIRPSFESKFRVSAVKEILQDVLTSKLHGVEYQVDAASTLTKEIADAVRDRVKGAEYDRYKLIVNVVIGERKGEGVRLGCRCLWDADTDNYAEHLFMNDWLFCVATVFGVYQY
jgi:hypothetical protein